MKPQALAIKKTDLISAIHGIVDTDALITSGIVGLTQDQSQDIINALSENAHLVWMAPRQYLENDPDFLQFIPYLILRTGGTDAHKVVGYNRPPATGESRLAGNFSIGLGGHVEPHDLAYPLVKHSVDERKACNFPASFSDVLSMCSQREMLEEVKPSWNNAAGETVSPEVYATEFGPVALIYDTSNDVGKVHLGLVYVVHLHGVSPAEDLILGISANSPDEVRDIRFLTKEEALNQESPESWTSLVLRHETDLLGLPCPRSDEDMKNQLNQAHGA